MDTESMVGRISVLLGAFGPRDRHLGVSELSRRTGLAKGTVSRICTQLCDSGFLERSGDQFELGIRLFELGQRATRPKDLRRLAARNMQDLRVATHGTVHLAVLEDTEVVYVEILRCEQSPKLLSEIGGRVPAHATAVGKALLAFSPSAVREEYLSRGLKRVGPQTITDRRDLVSELDRIRASGIAYEREESGVGVCCAASPIFAQDDQAVAAISVSGRIGRLDVRRVAPAVLTSALALSRDLSGRVPHELR